MSAVWLPLIQRGEAHMPGDFDHGYNGRVQFEDGSWVPAYLAGEVVT